MKGKESSGKSFPGSLPHYAGCGCYDCIRKPEQYQPVDAEVEAILMEGDRIEAESDDKAFMVHMERKGENW